MPHRDSGAPTIMEHITGIAIGAAVHGLIIACALRRRSRAQSNFLSRYPEHVVEDGSAPCPSISSPQQKHPKLIVVVKMANYFR